MAIFDTLTYARKLQEAGFTARQAEAQAEALLTIVEANLATKHDIELLRRDIGDTNLATKHDMALLRRDMELLRRDTKEMESRIVLRLGAIIVVAVGALAVLVKIL